MESLLWSAETLSALPTEMVHGRARAPSRQTLRVAANEVRMRVPPAGGDLVLFSETAISKRDVHIFVTPHPSESHPISLSPCVDRGVVGHIDTHTHTHIRAPTEEIFLRRRVRLDIRMV